MKRKDFIETVRRQLMQRRADLLDDVSSEDGLLSSLTINGEPGDSVDVAADSVAGEISASLADVEFREIANIDSALCRINDNTYGKCEGCKKSIPLARLEAIPHAAFCIDCKRLSEEHDTGNGISRRLGHNLRKHRAKLECGRERFLIGTNPNQIKPLPSFSTLIARKSTQH